MVAASRFLTCISRFKPNVYVTAAFSIRNNSNSASFFRLFGDIGHYRYKNNCVTSIPVGFHWVLPVFATLSKVSGNHHSFSKRASRDEGEVTDEVLNQILASVKNGGSRFAEEMCSACVEKLCRAGNMSAALRLLQSLRDKRIFFPKSYNKLLMASAETNDVGIAVQILKRLLVSSRTLSSDCYSNFARAFLKLDDCTQLLSFIEEVEGIAASETIIVVNRIIHAFGESRQVEKALLIFDHIKGLECKPDLITYNIVIDILGHVGRVNDIVHVFASMKKAGVVPDFVTYNTLLNNLRKIGRLDLCLVYFKEMGDSGIKPDLLTYTALIDSFGKTGNIEESLRLFNDMKHRQIRPSIYVYRLLISNLKKMGKVDLSMTLFEEMNSSLSELAGPKDFKRKAR